MCYMTVISTNCEKDLSQFNTRLMKFSKNLPKISESIFLKHDNKWFLESKDGCSCGFRHLDRGLVELGFSEPEDWSPEDEEDIQATLQVVCAFTSIINEGYKLDCIDAWAHDEFEEPKLAGELTVSLHAILAQEFRFFEGYRFEICGKT